MSKTIVIGDTHGDIERLRALEGVLGAGDCVLIAGDAGFIFDGSAKEAECLQEISEFPFLTMFVDGNHENFALLNQYPTEELFGGKAQQINEKFFHLMRGEVYEINGLRIFCFGGAYSPDCWMRREGINYWKQEMPNVEEYDRGMQKLREAEFRVDVILTHTAPISTVNTLCGGIKNEEELPLNRYLEEIKRKCIFKKWFFGHFHLDAEQCGKEYALAEYTRDAASGRILSSSSTG